MTYAGSNTTTGPFVIIWADGTCTSHQMWWWS